MKISTSQPTLYAVFFSVLIMPDLYNVNLNTEFLFTGSYENI